MFSIFSHQSSVHQSTPRFYPTYLEWPPSRKKKEVQGIEEEELCTQLVGMQVSKVTMKITNRRIPRKLKVELWYNRHDLAIPNLCTKHRYLYKHAHCSTHHKSQVTELAEIFVNIWLYRENMIHTHIRTHTHTHTHTMEFHVSITEQQNLYKELTELG